MTYEKLFHLATGFAAPRPWQAELATHEACSNRLINIPTGLGKTEGVALAWLWHRVACANSNWPRRLVWCLPMRVLVEQTVDRIDAMLRRVCAEDDSKWSAIAVHQVMGGLESSDWHLDPERSAIFVGTQDMLLSRALNRGYASARARWPIDFGLLNQDCLWVMDEVQLMDVALVTSVQMQAYRQAAPIELRPCRTWWMSATLQASWLHTAESASWLPALEREMVKVSPAGRADAVWRTAKRLQVESIPFSQDRKHTRLAERIWQEHAARPAPAVTLVVVNRVETAVQLARALDRKTASDPRATTIDVAHSRFRGRERGAWRDTFLNRAATENPSTDRIIVATQVIEAGADITCDLMVSELAPWTNLVQRFGRVARYGGSGRVIVVNREIAGKDTLPYREEDLRAALKALSSISDVGVDTLCRFEEGLPAAERETLYPYAPLHVLTPREHDELFDTTPDLTGADLDISRFIRSGDERDLTVAWARADQDAPDADVQPSRDDLCPITVSRVRDWLFDGGRLREGCRAWSWDYLDDEWRRLESRNLYPGQIILVAATWGGYDVRRGFTGEPAETSGPVTYPVAQSPLTPDESADRGDSRDDLSEGAAWKTIATHGCEVGAEAARLFGGIALNTGLVTLADLAGRVHDWGKAHPAFRTSIRTDHRLENVLDLAKAPKQAWRPVGQLYPEAPGDTVRRRGLRHELASMLAILELLARANPMHPAIIGDYIGTGLVDEASPDHTVSTNELARELSALSREQFDLLLYLVCAHHGKVRVALHVTPDDQDYPLEWREPERGLPLRGIRHGDGLPAVRLCASEGTVCEVPPVLLRLDVAAIGLSRRYGASWTERAVRLRTQYGPCALAFLEALFRTADVRASRATTPDPLVPDMVLA